MGKSLFMVGMLGRWDVGRWHVPTSLHPNILTPGNGPLAVRRALGVALRLLHADVLGAGQLGHALDPAGGACASAGFGREVDELDRRAVAGLILHPHRAAVVEGRPHLRGTREDCGW